MRNLADDAAAGGQHAGDENDALDQRHPLAETGQLLLHGDDHQGAHQRTEYRFEIADQRHIEKIQLPLQFIIGKFEPTSGSVI
jgi:hypothetical protein